MKKTLVFLFLLAFSMGFSKEIIKISGKFSNSTEKEIKLSSYLFKIEIPLNEDGSFSKEIEIEHPGIYNLAIDNHYLGFYFTKNTSVSIESDLSDFEKSLSVNGQNTNEYRYFLEQGKIFSDMNKDSSLLYSKKENDFITDLHKMIEENTTLLQNTPNLDSNFIRLEQNNIFYMEQYLLDNYKFSYSYYTKSNVPKAKEVAAKITFSPNYNEEEYCFSAYNRILTNNFFNKNFFTSFNKNSSKGAEYLSVEMQKIKSNSIKDDILNNLSRGIRTKSKNDMELYETIKPYITSVEKQKDLETKIEKIGKFINGSPAPNFEYQNQNGEKVSLESLKGKYVYLDIWATWCKPCVAEIPDLKKIEEKFKDKNIAFISVSIDSQKDYEKWKKFISDKNMSGIQLIADNAWGSSLVKDYLVTGIPKFILIDPNGVLLDIDAPRPSNSKLTKTLKHLDNLE